MLLDDLKDIVGPKGWISASDDLEPHVTEGRGALRGEAAVNENHTKVSNHI